MGRTQLLLLTALLLSLSGLLSPWVRADGPKSQFVLTGSDSLNLRNLVEKIGGRVVTHLRYHSGWIVELDSTQAFQIKATLALRTVTKSLNTLSLSQTDERLERDGEIHLIDAVRPAIILSDPSLRTSQKTPWGVQMVHAPEAFPIARGKAVTICVIDTGVQRSHPDLVGAIIGGDNTLARSPERLLTQADQDWDDDNGHGTHVTGTIAARDNTFGVVGVAPESRIFSVKALDARGAGSFSSLAEGVRSCMAHHAQIINMSLASSDESNLIREAVEDALSAGILIVAAAGNERGAVDYPAKLPGVIAVSALTPDHRISYFSNRGPEISFIAPGEEVVSTFPRSVYAKMQGTSQATPHVTGVAALLISAGVRDVKSHLRADDLGLKREAQGAGCIDAYKSLEDATAAF